VTVSTTGPNLGTQSRSQVGAALRTAWTLRLRSGQALGGGRPHPSARSHILQFFTLAWALVAGIVGLGR
jgi:hypothetical protein